jgi:hypothetical protein
MHIRFVAPDDTLAVEMAQEIDKRLGIRLGVPAYYYVTDWDDWAEDVNLSCSVCGAPGEEIALHSYGVGARRCVECSEGREVLR